MSTDGLNVQASPPAGPERHLLVLRDQLRRDYLTRADWDYALRDLAQMTREALGAREALVALYDEKSDTWTAYTSHGEKLADGEIPKHASRSILEQVRRERRPFVSTSQVPMALATKSIRAHGLQSVLSVPIDWWDVKERASQRSFGGCLYAHRTLVDSPFTDEDVELVLDITELAQRTLNVLRYLMVVETDLLASKERIRGLEARTLQYRLGAFETADPSFAENVLGLLQRAARADKVGVLLLGPTGSGKSFLAQSFHFECPRRDGPFVVLDCSQITSDETLAAELFGYAPRSGFANSPERGRAGMAELANHGTLFIEEIGVLPPQLQQRLLTLIETGTYSPLGSGERKHADIQVIAATNEDLPQLVREGRFREDLFWRLGEVVAHLPSLQERSADIPHLAHVLLHNARRRFGRTRLEGFTARALEALKTHDWSRAGNIRGLQQTLNRSVLLSTPEIRELDVLDLRFPPAVEGPRTSPEPASAPASPRSPSGARDARSAARTEPDEAPQHVPEKVPDLDTLLAAIREHGSGTAAARALGISRGVLIWQLRKAGMSIHDVL